MDLNKKHVALYQAINKRGIGRICNDLLPDEKAILTNAEWIEFCRAYHDYNGDPEEFDPKRPVMFDFMVVGFIEFLMTKNLLSNQDQKEDL